MSSLLKKHVIGPLSYHNVPSAYNVLYTVPSKVIDSNIKVGKFSAFIIL